MALTLNMFWKPETNGLELVSASSGSALVSSASPHHGTYHYRFDAAGEYVQFEPFGQNIVDADAGNGNYIVGFRMALADWTPLSTPDIIRLFEGANEIGSIQVQSDGDIELIDAAGASIRVIPNPGFTDGTYHLFELYFQNTAAGSIELFIDGVSGGLNTSQDLTDGGAFDAIRFSSTTTNTGDLDSFYFLSGAAADVVTTYTFDASDAGPTDPDTDWTDDANGFDGLTSTYAFPGNIGSTSSNFLLGEGTDAPSTGGVITQVRARLYGTGSAGDMNAAIYTNSLGELLGTATRSGGVGYGSYVTLSIPSSGWDWGTIQTLEVKNYADSASERIYVTEVEVTVGGSESRLGPFEVEAYQTGLTGAVSDGGLNATAAANLSVGTWDDTLDDAGDTTLASMDADPHYGTVDALGPIDSYKVQENQTGTDIQLFGRSTGNDEEIAQSFQLSGAETISSVALDISRTGSPGHTVIFEIQSDSSGEPDGVALASGRILAGSIPNDSFNGLVNFKLESPVALSGSTTYWIRLIRDGPLALGNHYRVHFDLGGNPYSSGEMLVFNSGSWETGTSSDMVFSLHTNEIEGKVSGIATYIRCERQGGGGTLHYIGLGNSGQGDAAGLYQDDGTVWGAITTAPADYFIFDETAANLPTSAENLRYGFGVDGAQNMDTYEQWGFLLHVLPVPVDPALGTFAFAGLDLTLRERAAPKPSGTITTLDDTTFPSKMNKVGPFRI